MRSPMGSAEPPHKNQTRRAGPMCPAATTAPLAKNLSLRGRKAPMAIRNPRPQKPPLRKGKSPKRCQWQKKRGDFEEVPRLAATIVAGNRLARRWAGWREAPKGSPHRTPCHAPSPNPPPSFPFPLSTFLFYAPCPTPKDANPLPLRIPSKHTFFRHRPLDIRPPRCYSPL